MLNLNSKFYYICLMMSIVGSLIFLGLNFLLCSSKVILLEIELMFMNSISYNFIFYLDWISLIFSTVVIVIASLILIYGKEYMGNNCYQFMWLTVLFILFMQLMIFSPSVLSVILGWDGLGLISYCLVIYYQSSDSFNSGFITAASNRLGDSMLVLGLVWFSTTSMFLFYECYSYGFSFFFLACLTKSAQIPFSAWLPSAMAAPTPISSLVHSSTLVTAGVYMLIRFESMLLVTEFSSYLMILSILTIYLAGVASFFENDLKRVVALSTLGQLGFMMMILSMGYSLISFFHLLVHALFKALLFMCAGAVIHSGGGVQDMRKMGNLEITYTLKLSLSISSLCLMGIPFTSGFYSKDFLLEIVMMNNSGLGLGLIMMVAALVTMSYSVRLLKHLASQNYWTIWLNSSNQLLIPIYFLLLFNICGGAVLSWSIMEDLDLILLPTLVKILPLMMICIALLWQGMILLKSFFYTVFYTMIFITPLSKTSSSLIKTFFFTMKSMDQGWFEMVFAQMKTNMVLSSKWLYILCSNSKYFMMLGMCIAFIMLV